MAKAANERLAGLFRRAELRGLGEGCQLCVDAHSAWKYVWVTWGKVLLLERALT